MSSSATEPNPSIVVSYLSLRSAERRIDDASSTNKARELLKLLTHDRTKKCPERSDGRTDETVGLSSLGSNESICHFQNICME